MSGGRFPFISRPIQITTSNKGIRITEGAFSPATANMVEGTYWIRGDGSADCLLTRMKTTLEAATASTNEYTVTASVQPLHQDTPVVITITRATGSDTFRLDFDNVATTFPVEAVGFRRVATALDANPKSGDRPAHGVWLADDMLSIDDPDEDGEVFGEQPASSGAYLAGSLSSPWEQHRWQVLRVSRNRTWGQDATYPDVSWQRFHRRIRGGAACELRTLEVGTTSPLAIGSADPYQVGGAGTRWIGTQEMRSRVGPNERNAPGQPFYGWLMTWRKAVTP